MERPTRIVIAGGGVGALEAAIALRALVGAEPPVTLVAPNDYFVYQPLSVAEPFALGPTPRLSLEDFANDLDVEWRQAAVDAVGETHAVLLEGGGFVAYDKLIVAVGAPREAAYENATTFRGEHDVQSVHGLVQDIEMGIIRRIAFVVPDGVAWSLPIYELALMTARRAHEMNVEVEVTLVTPEDRPLSVFGAKAAADVEALLAGAEVGLVTGTVAEIPSRGELVLPPDGAQLEVDRVIALPVSRGPSLAGLPSDADGFIPIDSFARVEGTDGVYAAGDGTNFPLKQGGLACQQADAAAEHIAWSLGKVDEPQPFRPVLRGALLTGQKPQFMRHQVGSDEQGAEVSADRALWWPATKVAGKYLAAYLTEVDRSREAGEELAPGVRRRAFLSPAIDDTLEVPLRGYEYGGRWGTATP